MFSFEYNSYNYRQVITDMAAALGTTVKDGKLIFPESVASGHIEFVEMPNGLQAIISDYRLNDQLYLKRQRIPREFYVLRYEDLKIEDEMTLKIDGEVLTTTNEHHAGVYLTSTLFDISYLGRKGSVIKGINIIFSKEWLAQHLHITDPDEVMATYLNLKTGSYTIEPIDNEYRRYFNEIITSDIDSPLHTATVQNRITLLIERFFSRLYEKSRTLLTPPRISKHDVHQLMHVEALLTQNVHNRPPTIDQLAQEAAMSSAKLKKLFKEVYGTSIYAYYQKQRMNVARDMLLSGDFTVKEVGLQVGYSNLSNFAAAFRKEFNILPSEIRA
ncbi:helix-turn-helix transcriptional regulator [Flavihumibacter petaseus]|uniref:Putative AraC family transcriptional regulator n=1 Tax=Flavihumibacter petaseus NBRC 106054 TaxID=1220578 RepID=A0A0E9N6V6_9BACT|nr:AraC family transcriptional regulator [Flavihumibacter petaseus]GAO45559.1 putative AraC family transcriptional regulator [Flavihumibacter petaseus NBRC 106054]